jgi:hypothetical protein
MVESTLMPRAWLDCARTPAVKTSKPGTKMWNFIAVFKLFVFFDLSGPFLLV